MKKYKDGYSVILPTFREHVNLRELLPELVHMFEDNKIRNYEIHIVDDNSNDGTVELVRELQAEKHSVTINVRKNVRGLASAIVDGTNQAAYNRIIHMDSDLAHRVVDLKRLIEEFSSSNDQDNLIVVGSRYLKKSTYRGKPFLNRLASFVGRRVITWYLHLPVIDSSNNFRIISHEVWDRIEPHLITEGNIMLVQILYLANQTGTKIKEIDTIYIERRVGESKLNVFSETVKFFKNIRKIKKYGR